MTNRKHPPGPWRVIHNKRHNSINVMTMPDDEGYYEKIALINGRDEAVAQLIAALPDTLVENTRLREENARLAALASQASLEASQLREALNKANNQAESFEREWYLRGDELERLREAVGLMTTMVPSMEIDANDPVGMAQKVCAEQARLSGKITLMHEAIDANYDYINLLKSDKTLQRIINQKIQSENDRLREALEPFAEMLKGNYSHQSDDMPIKAGANQYDLVFGFTLGDLRAARAAIREEKTNDQSKGE